MDREIPYLHICSLKEYRHCVSDTFAAIRMDKPVQSSVNKAAESEAVDILQINSRTMTMKFCCLEEGYQRVDQIENFQYYFKCLL